MNLRRRVGRLWRRSIQPGDVRFVATFGEFWLCLLGAGLLRALAGGALMALVLVGSCLPAL